MTISNLRKPRKGFHILETNKKSQSASMTLNAGEASSNRPAKHPRSEQTLLLLSGSLHGIIGRRRVSLKKGDAVTVPAATPHRFINRGSKAAITFNVYSPPAY